MKTRPKLATGIGSVLLLTLAAGAAFAAPAAETEMSAGYVGAETCAKCAGFSKLRYRAGMEKATEKAKE